MADDITDLAKQLHSCGVRHARHEVRPEHVCTLVQKDELQTQIQIGLSRSADMIRAGVLEG
jgi:hypothetical protein